MKRAVILAIFFGLFSFFFIHDLTFGSHEADFRLHLQFIVDHAWLGRVLYPALVLLFTLGSYNYAQLAWTSVFVLTFLVIFKVLISWVVLSKESSSQNKAFWFCIGLNFATSCYNFFQPSRYLGQITPTIWHNPTLIVCFPFALLLFFSAVKSLEEMNLKTILMVAIFGVLTSIAKPNYVFAFLPIYGIYFLVTCFQKKVLFSKFLFYSAILFSIVLILKLALHVEFQSSQHSDRGMMMAPFKVWNYYSHFIPLSLLLSFAFPFTCSILYWNQIKRDKTVMMAWLITLVAVIQFVLFSEIGDRYTHANFVWGSYVAIYVLFLVLLKVLAQTPKRDVRFYITTGIFLLHVASGIVYISRQLMGLGYV